ncbi:hypothetical protein X975_10030, partial [Stegodyphus mimosarum]
MHLGEIFLILILISFVGAKTCPDGRTCYGECCRQFPFGKKHKCCMPPFSCVRKFGFGLCIPFLPYLKQEMRNYPILQDSVLMQNITDDAGNLEGFA